jgi:hypothetical protein
MLWESPDCKESELSEKEVNFIRKYQSNDPGILVQPLAKFQYKYIINC